MMNESTCAIGYNKLLISMSNLNLHDVLELSGFSPVLR